MPNRYPLRDEETIRVTMAEPHLKFCILMKLAQWTGWFSGNHSTLVFWPTFGLNTRYLDWLFRGVLKFLQTNARLVSRLRHDHILPHVFQIRDPSIRQYAQPQIRKMGHAKIQLGQVRYCFSLFVVPSRLIWRWRPRLVFRRCLFQISAEKTACIAGVFLVFPTHYT
jgi:hypothetical protein